MAYKLAIEFDPSVSSVLIDGEQYVSTKVGKDIMFVPAKESSQKLLVNAILRDVDDFGALVEETEVQLQSLKDALVCCTASKFYVKVETKEFGDRTLSVFSAVGLAALTFNAELAYAAASESGLVIEGLYLYKQGEPVKMVEVQDLVLFPERTTQNDTMEALLAWMISMVVPKDPAEWREVFIKTYATKLQVISHKQAVPSTISVDGKERKNPFLEAVLAWDSNARQEAVILREVVEIFDGEEQGDAASRKRKRADAGAQRGGRGAGRGPRGGRGTRGRKRAGKGTPENAAANDESVLSKERLCEVLSVALSNAQLNK